MIRDVVTVTPGVRIHYRRDGSGPGMVLLHGYPQTGHMWRKVMPALAERFTVVAPDLRGYGDSDRPPAGYDKRTMAADVAELLRALGLTPVVLVGHDRAAPDRHRKIAVPPLVLWGQSRPTQAADMLAVWQPRCERVEGFAVPDCGHFIPEEQPGAVVKAVLKFVASGAGPSGS